MRYFFLFLLLLTLSPLSLKAQSSETASEDPVLFTVNGHPVRVSEFVYIYEKSNGDKADYSRKSLDEYLRLYKKFKLKVERARELRLDTIRALQQELEGYRRQLADSYLIDREVTEKLVREVYDRKKQDVDISHILIKIAPNAGEEAEKQAYERALQARKELLEGKSFSEVARRYSEDKSVARNEGHIGYVTAMFPKGLYQLETAAYHLPKGEVSEPIRTSMGYHILVVHDRRPARGEIEAAHILIRKPKEGDKKNAKATIDSIYQLLLQGASFEELAKQLSEDKLSASRGGYIGFFGINRYEKSFEDAAFALEKDGDFSAPFETAVGWHIVKRISKRNLGPYADERARILKAIKKDPRFEEAQDALIKKIKKEANFKEFNTTLSHFADTLSEDFLSYKWKAPKEKSNEPLFSLGDDFLVTLGDFTDFLGKSTRERIRMGRSVSVKEGVQRLYEEFVKRKVLEYEERHLADKYPDFRHLMREYEEGILLFEVTKREVWDVAPKDTAGLMAYYETIKGRYRWKERAVTSVYIIHNIEDPKLLKKIRKYIAKKPPEKVLAKFNTDPDNPLIERGEKIIEKGKNRVLNTVAWKVGAMTEPEINKKEGTAAFYKIEQILPEQPKTLDESRGFVIADYQDYLERKWVKQLEEKFPVKVNQKVFESLIKE